MNRFAHVALAVGLAAAATTVSAPAATAAKAPPVTITSHPATTPEGCEVGWTWTPWTWSIVDHWHVVEGSSKKFDPASTRYEADQEAFDPQYIVQIPAGQSSYLQVTLHRTDGTTATATSKYTCRA